MRIVIVEDEINIREGMAKLIESHTEHTIVGEGQNGKEGLDLILRFKPDLLITDIQMPVMNGLDMIKEIYDMGIRMHTVILSGYSEFEYAKKAIHYGVDDYLLKPLAAEDVQELLFRINDRIKEERQLVQGTKESYIRDILFGNKEDYNKLAQICGFLPDMRYLLIEGYLGSAPATYINDVENSIVEMRRRYNDLLIFTFYQESSRMYYCLVAGYIDMVELKMFFYKRLIYLFKGKQEQPLWVEESFNHYQDLKHIGDNLNQYIKYGLSLRNVGWINKNVINDFKPENYLFPLELYSRLKNSICSNNPEDILRTSQEFLEYVRIHSFEPEHIRQFFFKTFYMISDLLFDFEKSLYDKLKSTNALRLIGEAITWAEMEKAFMDIIKVVSNQQTKREDISNYTIKKAINYIREHYQESITLEDVAGKLDITQEYLSTLFYREMEVNFSTFLKQFRISHAKRLLKGSDLRIYQISEMVGYSDPKYFMRVFKEEVGVSPKDYRQSN